MTTTVWPEPVSQGKSATGWSWWIITAFQAHGVESWSRRASNASMAEAAALGMTRRERDIDSPGYKIPRRAAGRPRGLANVTRVPAGAAKVGELTAGAGR